MVNESPTEKLIRELREENARLMDMLKSGGTMPAAPASGGGGGGDASGETPGGQRVTSLQHLPLKEQ